MTPRYQKALRMSFYHASKYIYRFVQRAKSAENQRLYRYPPDRA
ncbi:hypothetical protein C4K40_6181 [Pseudomonas sp. CMR5c]|nr:hypothetical protein C4K40_6181 [Pseudomonas sp. CMR5c]